jgi:hypothetical protein
MEERGDCIETELKFEPPDALEEAVDLFRAAIKIKQGWLLTKTPCRIIHDIYFDTARFSLLSAGISFRFRKQARAAGYVACMKSMLPAAGYEDTLVRRKVRTNLSVAEAKSMLEGKLPGDAARMLAAALSSQDLRLGDLRPVVLLVQVRDRFTTRPNGYNDFGRMGSEPLHMMIDNVTAFDVRAGSADTLLEYLEVDCSDNAPRCVRFRSGEIEIEPACIGNPEVHAVFDALKTRLVASTLAKTKLDKYRESLARLQIAPQLTTADIHS